MSQSENVYERCPACKADTFLRDGCRQCSSLGFIETGLTVAQVEAHAADAKRLQHVKALRLSLLAPKEYGGRKSWGCQTPLGTFSLASESKVFHGLDPRAAIDAAIKGLGLS